MRKSDGSVGRRGLRDSQAKRAPQTTDFGIDAAIQNALENAERSGPELAEQAVAYAKRLEASGAPEDAIGSRTNTVVSTAMMVARDGADALLDEHEPWVRGVFASVFASTDRDVARSMRNGIRFNPVAIATLGFIHLWRRRRSAADRDLLLELAGHETAEAAQGFGAGLDILCEIDQRLIPAALRCALSAQIHPTGRWDDPEEKKAARQAQYHERVRTTIESERAWLRGDTHEPNWPQFPAPMLHIKRGLRIGARSEAKRSSAVDRPDEEVYTQRSALWLRQLTRNSNQQVPDWLSVFVDTYADWTACANGAGYEPRAEIESRLDEWNSAFFHLFARTLPGRGPDQASAAVARVVSVPDRSFFDVAENLVPALDELHFNDLGLDLETALRLRGIVADRFVESAGWRREQDRSEMSVEMWVGPAIGVLFFNNYSSFGGARCYLREKGIDRVDSFFPQLAHLIEEGSVPFTALLTMNVLEVSPRSEHTAFFLSSALTWLRRQPSNTPLWVDGGLGARLARWLETVTTSDTALRAETHPLRAQMDNLLARLVQVGVAEAHRVERSLM